MNLDLQKLLPHGNDQEKQLIAAIISLNGELKDEFNVEDEIRLAKLRMASSETQASNQWIQAISLMQAHLEKNFLSMETLLDINFLLSGHKGLRKERVTAGTHEFPHHDQVVVLMEKFQQYSQQIHEPISRAAFIYQVLCTIHPFVDGNGRTARLVADHTLISNGFAPLIFPAPTMAFVIPSLEEKHPHLLALKRVQESTAWMVKLFGRPRGT